MLHKLTLDNLPEKPDWLITYGDYNTLPEPRVEIDEANFWAKCLGNMPKGIEYKQVFFPPLKYYTACRVYWFHNFALAVVHPHDWSLVEGKVNFYSKPLYFEIGCQHEWGELSPEKCRGKGISHYGMCWHVVECLRCGYIESYDSSD